MQVNIFAVIAAAMANMVIGYAWYSTALFGQKWMGALGLNKEVAKAGMGKAIALGFVTALITSYVLGVAMILAGITTAATGALAGFVIAIGLVVTTMYGAVIWSGRSQTAFIIEAAYQLVTFAAMASLLAVWG
ncbi:MAG: DUF1761 domain-containing protein [Patescibacteria group bacterium]